MKRLGEDFPPPPFEGFAADSFAFFEELAGHQTRDWFAANRHRYEQAVTAPLSSLVANVSDRLAEEGIPLRGDPKRALFRIHRDVRFSKNKDPYKTTAGAVLTRDGGKHAIGVLYFHFDPTGSFAAVGFYHPEPDLLQGMRTWLADKPGRWHEMEAALAKHRLTLSRDDTLVRPPKGFETADADILEALKLKSWVVTRELSRTALGKTTLVETLVKVVLDAEPLLRFGWSAVDRMEPKRSA